MGRLTFVGLGLGDQGASIAGLNAIRESDISYLEYYTTPHVPRLLKELETASGRTLVVVDRNFVEDGKRILQEAKEGIVVLAVQGDPMIATTHSDLRVRATSGGIETSVIHGTTIASAARARAGSTTTSSARTVTFTRDSVNYHQQVYGRVHQNLLEGSHTLLLLEFDTEKGVGATPGSLMEGLLAAERNFKREVIGEKTFVVVLSRVGTGGGADPRRDNRGVEVARLWGVPPRRDHPREDALQRGRVARLCLRAGTRGDRRQLGAGEEDRQGARPEVR